MAIRSTTGCYTCKTRRKKCDETHPQCQRCTKSGITCSGYEYITSKDGRLRTKPAPKITPSTSQTPTHSRSTTSVVQTTLGHLEPNDVPQKYRTESLGSSTAAESRYPVARVALPQDTNLRTPWQALPITRQHPHDVQIGRPVHNPTIEHEPGSESYLPASTPLSSLQRLNPGQASLYRALFSLEHAQSNLPPSDRLQSLPAPEERYEEGDNLEGVQEIWVSTPVMDRSVASNLLPFVLQSYANWMMFVAFEPSQSAYGTKNLRVRQLEGSEHARERIKLISETMRAICETGSANSKAAESVSILVRGVHETVVSYKARPGLGGSTVAALKTQAESALYLLDLGGSIPGTVELLGIALGPTYVAQHPGPRFRAWLRQGKIKSARGGETPFGNFSR